MRKGLRVIRTVLLCTCIFSISGCATIFRGTQQTFDFRELPQGTEVTVYGAQPEPVYQGEANESVELPRKISLTERARYRAVFEHPDFHSRYILLEPVDSTAAAFLSQIPLVFSLGAWFTALAAWVDDAPAPGDPFAPEPDPPDATLAALGLLGWVVGLVIDSSTGSYVTYRPTSVAVELPPLSRVDSDRFLTIDDMIRQSTPLASNDTQARTGGAP